MRILILSIIVIASLICLSCCHEKKTEREIAIEFLDSMATETNSFKHPADTAKKDSIKPPQLKNKK